MYFVYMLRCRDDSLYTGITTDVARRLQEHVSGKGAVYTRTRGVEGVAYTESCIDRSHALKREHSIKSLTREGKLALVASGATS